jgi:hypothetical protein
MPETCAAYLFVRVDTKAGMVASCFFSECHNVPLNAGFWPDCNGCYIKYYADLIDFDENLQSLSLNLRQVQNQTESEIRSGLDLDYFSRGPDEG